MNALRYTEYLGMLKIERQITRKVLKGPGLRVSAPPPSSGGASHKVREVTAKNLLAATGELRDRQGKLFRATVVLIGAVKEAEEGPWEAGSGLLEEALREWLGVQVSRTDELKESLDQKRSELAMQVPVRKKKGSGEKGQKYGAQDEWKREEKRRFRQQTRKDQEKQAHKQG